MQNGCFRPLAGINCNWILRKVCYLILCFRPLTGCKLQFITLKSYQFITLSFRPLAGINCNNVEFDGTPTEEKFPSPYGYKLQLGRWF